MVSSSRQATQLQIAGVTVFLRRSNRRTLGLQVRNGVATAYAPAQMSLATVEAFIASKRDWLAKHLQEQRQAKEVAPLQLGSSVPFLGEQITLRPLAAAVVVRREQDELFVPTSNWEDALKNWTRRAVLTPYTKLVQEYAAELGARARLRSVKVSDTSSRWGSCAANGDIRLHWALSRAPVMVLRYVALHEAAHLLEMNHSARYWAHVAQVMPEHRLHRAWLRQNGPRLMAGKS